MAWELFHFHLPAFLHNAATTSMDGLHHTPGAVPPTELPDPSALPPVDPESLKRYFVPHLNTELHSGDPADLVTSTTQTTDAHGNVVTKTIERPRCVLGSHHTIPDTVEKTVVTDKDGHVLKSQIVQGSQQKKHIEETVDWFGNKTKTTLESSSCVNDSGGLTERVAKTVVKADKSGHVTDTIRLAYTADSPPPKPSAAPGWIQQGLERQAQAQKNFEDFIGEVTGHADRAFQRAAAYTTEAVGGLGGLALAWQALKQAWQPKET